MARKLLGIGKQEKIYAVCLSCDNVTAILSDQQSSTGFKCIDKKVYRGSLKGTVEYFTDIRCSSDDDEEEAEADRDAGEEEEKTDQNGGEEEETDHITRSHIA